MRSFTEIQVGMSLSFLFEGRRFSLSSHADDPDIAELLRLGTDIDLSFYKTEMWRRDFIVAANEWGSFEEQFPAAIAGTREVIRQAWIAREERDHRQRADAERLAAIERELRRQEIRTRRALGDASVIERPGQHFLELTAENYWDDNVRKPITKPLHDMLIAEIGTRAAENWEDDYIGDDDDDDEV